MSSLLWLPFIVASPFASWWIARKLSSVPKWLQWALIPLLWGAAFAAVSPFFVDWSFSIPGLTTVAYLAALLAAIVPLYLLWNLTRDLLPAGLNVVIAVPVAGVALFYVFAKHLFTVFIVLLLINFQPRHTLLKGSISPTLSYQIQSAFFMGKYEQYAIYRHPRWFPLVHKRVASSALYCDDARVAFSPGPDSHSVLLTCNGRDNTSFTRPVRLQ
jgi:hypothetical protein